MYFILCCEWVRRIWKFFSQLISFCNFIFCQSGCLLFLSKRIQRRRGKVPPTMEDDGQHNDHPKKRYDFCDSHSYFFEAKLELSLIMSKNKIIVYDIHNTRWGIMPLHHLIIMGYQVSTNK